MLKIKWLGQGGYLLWDEDTAICIDPYLSDAVNRIAGRPRAHEAPFSPEELRADAVICTHNHLDHVDVDAIPRMDKSIDFFAPTDCKSTLIDLGVMNYREFNEGDFAKLGNFELTAVFADHSVPAVGVLVKHGNDTLYFTGDTLFNERLADIKCDILFVCINGKLGNMNVEEAIKLTKLISPKTAVPNHYDMFESNSEDPERFDVTNSFIMCFNREYEIITGYLCEGEEEK